MGHQVKIRIRSRLWESTLLEVRFQFYYAKNILVVWTDRGFFFQIERKIQHRTVRPFDRLEIL